MATITEIHRTLRLDGKKYPVVEITSYTAGIEPVVRTTFVYDGLAFKSMTDVENHIQKSALKPAFV